MPSIDLGVADFQDAIETNDVVLVDFWASWCAPCQDFAAIYEAAADDNPDLVFASVNIDTERILAGALQVRSIPTLMAFKRGRLVLGTTGQLSEDRLADLIAKLRGLDVGAAEPGNETLGEAASDVRRRPDGTLETPTVPTYQPQES